MKQTKWAKATNLLIWQSHTFSSWITLLYHVTMSNLVQITALMLIWGNHRRLFTLKSWKYNFIIEVHKLSTIEQCPSLPPPYLPPYSLSFSLASSLPQTFQPAHHNSFPQPSCLSFYLSAYLPSCLTSCLTSCLPVPLSSLYLSFLTLPSANLYLTLATSPGTIFKTKWKPFKVNERLCGVTL